jgi:hypothetical protein
MAALNSQYYLISYANKQTQTSTLQLVEMSATNVNSANVVKILSSNYFIYEIATLSSTSSAGYFVAICQDYSALEETAFVVVGEVVYSSNSIVLSTTNALYSTGYSLNPQITVLSGNSFALAYYNGQVNFAETRYGTVDIASLSVSLSNGFFFANDSHNSTYFNMAPLTDTEYMLFYYDSVFADGADQPGRLHAMVATVSNEQSTASTAVISLSNSTILNSALVSEYFAATSLGDNNTVAIAFIDASQNNAVVVQTVSYFRSLYYNPIVYGSNWIVHSGAAYENSLKTGIMDLDIELISKEDRQFLVLYSDMSNQGAVLATAGQVTHPSTE